MGTQTLCTKGNWKIKHYVQKFHEKLKTLFLKVVTSGGRQSSACLRRTENPPWVLVSEAVSVLQNEWTVHLSGSGSGGSGLVISPC